MKNIVFFNNKGGVGKTSLVYHIAWMLAKEGYSILAVDLDPQANLTSMFLEDERLEQLWPEEEKNHQSIMKSINPFLKGTGDIAPAPIESIRDNLHLIPGDLALSRFEDSLSANWPLCLDKKESAFRVSTAFYRIIYNAAQELNADIVLTDVGPNLGAINRSALIAADYLVIPLASDLYSLQGLRNLGPTVQDWRKGWRERLDRKPTDMDIPLPSGDILPLGYIVMQHIERKNRPTQSYRRWIEKMPSTYRAYITPSSKVKQSDDGQDDPDNDPNRIGMIRHYQSLMPMAQEARKPIFMLKPADGAIGAHAGAVARSYRAFADIAADILRRADINLRA